MILIRRRNAKYNLAINLSNSNTFLIVEKYVKNVISQLFSIFFQRWQILMSSFFDQTIRRLSNLNKFSLIWWKCCYSSIRQKFLVNEFRAFFLCTRKSQYHQYKHVRKFFAFAIIDLFVVVRILTNFYNLSRLH